jgi:hypothetical protein
MAKEKLSFPIGEAGKLNSVSSSERKILREAQRIQNSVGLVLRWRCGRLIKKKRCLGKVTRTDDNKIECQKCGAKWLLA